MTRGKHGQAAAARKAVQTAERERDAAVHDRDDLSRRLRDAETEAARQQSIAAAKIDALEAQIQAGTGAELENALATIADLRDELENLPYVLLDRAGPVLKKMQMQGVDPLVALAEAFGVDVGDIFVRIGEFDRRTRRMTNRQARFNTMLRREPDSIPTGGFRG